MKSALDSIPGIGPKSRDLLLSHFKSVKRIKEASESDLMAVVGTAKAKIIKKIFDLNYNYLIFRFLICSPFMNGFESRYTTYDQVSLLLFWIYIIFV